MSNVLQIPRPAALDTRGFVFRIGEKVKIATCPQDHPEAEKFVNKIGVVGLIELPMDSFFTRNLAQEPQSIRCYINLDDGQKIAFDARCLEPVELLMNKIIKLSNPTDYWSQNNHAGVEAFRVYTVRHGDKHPEDYMDQPNEFWKRKVINFQKNRIVIDYHSLGGFVSYMRPEEWPRLKLFQFKNTVRYSDRVKTLGNIGVQAECMGCVEDSKGGAYLLIMFRKFEFKKK
jgi:hypothetical protein